MLLEETSENLIFASTCAIGIFAFGLALPMTLRAVLLLGELLFGYRLQFKIALQHLWTLLSAILYVSPTLRCSRKRNSDRLQRSWQAETAMMAVERRRKSYRVLNGKLKDANYLEFRH